MLIFIGTAIASVVLFKFGAYAAIISLIITASKIFAALAALALIVLVFMRYRKSKNGIILSGVRKTETSKDAN